MAKRSGRKRNEGVDPLPIIGAAALLAVATPAVRFLSAPADGAGVLLLFVLLAAAAAGASFLWLRRLGRQKRAVASLREIDLMSGTQFEQFMAGVFRRLGYAVETTPATNDFGADLILTGRGKRIAVQAKRWSAAVGIQAVQEAHASVAHYRASEGWVIATSGFTRSARDLAASTRIRLVGRDEMIGIVRSAMPDLGPAAPRAHAESAPPAAGSAGASPDGSETVST